MCKWKRSLRSRSLENYIEFTVDWAFFFLVTLIWIDTWIDYIQYDTFSVSFHLVRLSNIYEVCIIQELLAHVGGAPAYTRFSFHCLDMIIVFVLYLYDECIKIYPIRVDVNLILWYY